MKITSDIEYLENNFHQKRKECEKNCEGIYAKIAWKFWQIYCIRQPKNCIREKNSLEFNN
ncbi:hypothetical protein BpHYR1_048660 [Brachionus plicatilis]|uniref:Uncharacterized protein n=1 Tax=Brachionus plicatilis TaxID=10195 RepID=A0A3M7RPG0_BRAPC|nr:hypothetical protein BpHYR1_048660 [Brachionus plicatilis]